MALDDIIDKLVEFKIVMMIINSLGGVSSASSEIKNDIIEIKSKIDNHDSYVRSKLGPASLKIREIYGVRITYYPAIEDLVKYKTQVASLSEGGIEDLVIRESLYTAGIVYSIEEVENQ